MSYDPNPPDHPYVAPRQGYEQYPQWQGQQLKQSGLGIASLVIAILAGVAIFALIVYAGMMAASSGGEIDEESPLAIALGLGLFAVIGLHLLGIGLGVAGLFQSNRARTVAVLGLTLNFLIIAGFVCLMVIGLTVAA